MGGSIKRKQGASVSVMAKWQDDRVNRYEKLTLGRPTAGFGALHPLGSLNAAPKGASDRGTDRQGAVLSVLVLHFSGDGRRKQGRCTPCSMGTHKERGMRDEGWAEDGRTAG